MGRRAVNLLSKRSQGIAAPTVTGGNVAVTAGTLDVQDGGTITQATSKVTGVTLNTHSGQITMDDASLAAATEVVFTVTNSAVAAQDVIILNHGSGGTAGAYTMGIASVSAGSFEIWVGNHTGGGLAESPVLHFVVIKGAAS